MPAYSFSLPEFKTQIPEGKKIRTTRLMKNGKRFDQAKNAMVKGTPASLYWKQRTKESKLLLRAPIIRVGKVSFVPPSSRLFFYQTDLILDGRKCSSHECELYGRQEGFEGTDCANAWEHFLEAVKDLHGHDFWKHEYYTIEWRPNSQVLRL